VIAQDRCGGRGIGQARGPALTDFCSFVLLAQERDVTPWLYRDNPPPLAGDGLAPPRSPACLRSTDFCQTNPIGGSVGGEKCLGVQTKPIRRPKGPLRRLAVPATQSPEGRIPHYFTIVLFPCSNPGESRETKPIADGRDTPVFHYSIIPPFQSAAHCAKQSQFRAEGEQGQVLYGKRVTMNLACQRPRENKANLGEPAAARLRIADCGLRIEYRLATGRPGLRPIADGLPRGPLCETKPIGRSFKFEVASVKLERLRAGMAWAFSPWFRGRR
jgi:hypothetical protein